ncbi:MAG TPA: beta-galactosidase [Thermoguttaceae bacterium]|nr:beta-galactosidase [Thermoguttaceae bacterium]
MTTVNKILTRFCVSMAMLVATAEAAEQFPVEGVLFTGGDLADWSPTRDESRLKEEYVHHRLRHDADEPCLVWEFATREQAYADVFLVREVREPFDRIVARVRNDSAQPADVWLKLTESDGSDYSTEPVRVPSESGWIDVSFDLAAYRVASWSKDENHSLDFPLRQVGLVAFNVKPEAEYRLSLGRLGTFAREPERVEVTLTGLPPRVEAGTTLQLKCELTPKQPLRESYGLAAELVVQGVIQASSRVDVQPATDAWKVGRPQHLPVELIVPRYAVGGPGTIALRLGRAKLVAPGTDEEIAVSTEIIARTPARTVAEIKPHNGVPALFLNGKPNAAMTYMTYHPEAKHFASFGKAGVDLVSFSATSDFSHYGLAPPVWIAPEQFDYSTFDRRVLLILEANPEAYLIPRVYISSPPWWDEQHPEELVVWHDGARDRMQGGGKKTVPSWASDKWRKDAGEALRRFIRHVQSMPYADRFLGYHVASGGTEEWYYWNNWTEIFADYSGPQRKAFVRYLREKYGDEAALRKAWGDDGVTFDSVQIPTKEARIGRPGLRDPQREMPVIDYYAFHAEIVADTIGHFARVVKEETNGRKLFGAFYGYIFEMSWYKYGLLNSGHLALATVLANPDVDFLTSPTAYSARALDGGAACWMTTMDSVKLHGKLWMDENDVRTHNTPNSAGYGRTDGAAETRNVQLRELAMVLGDGTGMWWFDMGGGWYDDEPTMAAIARMNAVAEDSVHRDRSSSAEIAVLADERSMFFCGLDHSFDRPLLYDQKVQLYKIGAPIDTFLLSDLGAIGRYKMYVFLNAFCLDDAQRELIRQRTRQQGAVSLFVYAPGVFRPDGSAGDPAPLLGMKVARIDGPAKCRVIVDPDAVESVAGLAATEYGSDHAFAPRFCVDDPAVTALGTLAGTERTGLAMKSLSEGGTVVYSAAPNLPAAVLRAFARKAGVHIYLDTDEPVYGNRSYLGFTVYQAGKRTLRLPRRTPVYDLYEQRFLSEDAEEIVLELPAKTTKLLLLGKP